MLNSLLYLIDRFLEVSLCVRVEGDAVSSSSLSTSSHSFLPAAQRLLLFRPARRSHRARLHPVSSLLQLTRRAHSRLPQVWQVDLFGAQPTRICLAAQDRSVKRGTRNIYSRLPLNPYSLVTHRFLDFPGWFAGNLHL